MFLTLITSRIVASIIAWIRLELDNGDEGGVLQLQMLEATQKARHSGNEGGVDEIIYVKGHREEVAAKKVMSLTQNVPGSFFCNSIFAALCLMRLW